MTRAILPSKYTKYKVLIFFFLRARIVITNYTYKAPPTDIYSFEVLWEECHLIHFFFVPFNFTVFPFVFRKWVHVVTLGDIHTEHNNEQYIM